MGVMGVVYYREMGVVYYSGDGCSLEQFLRIHFQLSY